MSCGVGHRRISDPALLWLWLAAVALIGPLAWETPYATGAALKRPKKIFFLNSQKDYMFLLTTSPKKYRS